MHVLSFFPGKCQHQTTVRVRGEISSNMATGLVAHLPHGKHEEKMDDLGSHVTEQNGRRDPLCHLSCKMNREAGNRSDDQEIPRLLCSPEVHCHIHYSRVYPS
jgi:hypothetical protein